MLTYILMGLICSSAGCEWTRVNKVTFSTIAKCQEDADWIRPRTAAYFDFKCVIEREIIPQS